MGYGKLCYNSSGKVPSHKKVVLIDRPVRVDKMSNVSEKSNAYLKEIVDQMNNVNISVANHNIHKQGATKDEIVGEFNNKRNDGIHPNGNKGKNALQASFLNIFKMSLNQ